MANEKQWNISVGLGSGEHRAVTYAAAQHGLSVRAWGARVLETGARLALFGDYLRSIAEDGENISTVEAVALVRKVEDFKIAADPHPKREPLDELEVQAIAASVRDPLDVLVACEVGRQRNQARGPHGRPEPAEEITLCLPKAVHNLLLSAASVSGRTKRELAQDLLGSAGAMGRTAGLKRQARLCRGDRVGPGVIVETWVGMLVAAGCISGDEDANTAGPRRRFRSELVNWYLRHYSHRGVETLEADLEDRPAIGATGD